MSAIFAFTLATLTIAVRIYAQHLARELGSRGFVVDLAYWEIWP